MKRTLSMALMAKKNLTAQQFYALYFDYAMTCATSDFAAAASLSLM
ncbi:MAG: hypothetical protein IJ209_03095 [Bacteroidaceae bacterium]|nr:hypothetical protein [Bacteroidaceae bacterium]